MAVETTEVKILLRFIRCNIIDLGYIKTSLETIPDPGVETSLR